jgi:HK97 family phage major capsid protein
MSLSLAEARTLHAEAVERMEAYASELSTAGPNTPSEHIEAVLEAFDRAEAEAEQFRQDVGRLERIERARCETLSPDEENRDTGDGSDIAADVDAKRAHEPKSEALKGVVERHRMHNLLRDEGKHTAARARIIREPLTYERTNKDRSFFLDLVRANVAGDMQARQRLERHNREMAVELRDLSSTDGAGGEFVQPIWMMDEWVNLARATRPTANLFSNRPLPGNTDSINLPKLLTGTATSAQADAGAVQETDATTGSVSIPVKTVAGMTDVSRQLLDRSQPGIDEVLFADLTADYNYRLNLQVLSGGGSGANAKGILSDSNRLTITYTDASPTVPELTSKIADAIQQIGTNRFLPPTAIVMHPRRWAWATTAADTTGRPLISPTAGGGQAMNSVGSANVIAAEGPVGTIAGLPVYTDAGLPITNGAGTNEDVIIVARFSDGWLFEDGAPRRATYESIGSGNLLVRLQLYGYFAASTERYSKAFASISGTGLVAPTF